MPKTVEICVLLGRGQDCVEVKEPAVTFYGTDMSGRIFTTSNSSYHTTEQSLPYK